MLYPKSQLLGFYQLCCIIAFGSGGSNHFYQEFRMNLSTWIVAAFLVVAYAVIPANACARQEDIGKRMEDAIKLMESSGAAAEPSAMYGLYVAAANGHVMNKDYKKALGRLDQAFEIYIEGKMYGQGQFLFTVAKQVLSNLDDEVASKYFLSKLKAVGDDQRLKQELLDSMASQFAETGNLVLAIQTRYELLGLIQETNSGGEEEIDALDQFVSACVTGRLIDMAVPAIKRGNALALKLKRPDFGKKFSKAIMEITRLTGETEIAEAAILKTIKLLKLSRQEVRVPEGSNRQLALATIDAELATAYQQLIFLQIKSGQLDEAEKTIAIARDVTTDEVSKAITSKIQATIELIRFDETKNQKRLLAAIKLRGTGITQTEKALEKSLPVSNASFNRQESIGMSTAHMRLELAGLYLVDGKIDLAVKLLEEAEVGFRGIATMIERLEVAGVASAERTASQNDGFRVDLLDFRQQILVAQGEIESALVVAESARANAQAKLLSKRLGIDINFEDGASLDLDGIKRIAREQAVSIVVYSLVHHVIASDRGLFPSDHPLANPHSIYAWVVSPDGEVDFKATKLRFPVGVLVDAARSEIDRGKLSAPVIVSDEASQDAESSSSSSDGKLAKAASGSTVEGSPVVDSSARGDRAKLTSVEGIESPMRTLHELLIEPIESWLPTGPTRPVVFVPQGELFLLPLAALPDADSVPLIEKHAFTIVSSIEMLELAAKQKLAVDSKGNTDLLVVGNPTMPAYLSRPDKPAKPLDPLTGAEVEAKFLGQLLGTTPLIAGEATETSVVQRMKSARWIHLATHGLLEADNVYEQAYLSAVALAPSESDDGFLTVRETMKLDLGADLVVLSACDTGRGKITGDGVIGLSRGYLLAGSPTVVASLWPVSDRATVFVMKNFYESLKRGRTKVIALREAMLETRKQFPNAREWAPFSMYGLGN